MTWYQILLAILLGYIIGSIPPGYLIGKAKGIDVRQYGSGRTGGTNVYRALGLGFGLLTGLSDGAKGLVAVLLARWLFGHEAAAALAGAFAVAGHNWPVFLRFKGGAGGGTAAGSLIALNPLAAAITVPIFLAVLIIGRYASVATMSIAIGSALVLIVMYVFDWGAPAEHLIFSGLTILWILWALRPNIKRLINGTERRIDFRKRQGGIQN